MYGAADGGPVSEQEAVSRRRFLLRCAAAGVALPSLPLLLDACGSSKKSAGQAPGTTSTSAQPASNQAMTIGVGQDGYVTSGAMSYLGMYPLNANVYEQLVRLEPDYSMTPLLAQSWEQTGPNTVRFHLRPGVTFHDGTPFGAADVKYTFDRMASAGGGLVGLGPSSTVVVDNLTVDVTPKKPNLRLVEQVVHPEYSILKQGTEPGANVAGTGPFRFTEYVRQSHVSVVRNETYWGTRAKPASITFNFVPDDNSRGLALASGQLDVAQNLPRPALASLKRQSGIQVLSAPVGEYNAMYVNIHGKAPYTLGADPAVRLALETGIDRQGLVKSVFGGYAVASQTFLPAALLGPAASVVKGFDYDPNKAMSALDAAGWKAGSDGIRSKNGTPLQLVLVNGFPNAATNAGVPEFIQADLRKIGIGITVTSEPDTPSYMAARKQGAGDLFLETGSQNDANPAFLPEIIFFSSSPVPAYPAMFAPGPSVDDPIKAALAATTDDAAKQAVASAIHQLVDVSQVLVALAGLFQIYGLRSNIRGLVPHPSGVNQSWAPIYRV